MGAIDFFLNQPTQNTMYRQCKAIAGKLLLHKPPHQAVLVTNPCKIASPAESLSPFSANLRTTVTINKDTVDSGDMEMIFQEKRALRSRVRKLLKNMDPVQRSQEDDAIQSILLEAPWFKDSKSLCAYISCASLREVDTSRIVSEVLTNPSGEGNAKGGKKLYVPRVEDRSSNMRMLRISSVDDLVANSMHILEPDLIDSYGNQREDVLRANEPVDLFVLPGLAFDRSGRRLGRSGGYYDVFLKKYQDLAKEQ